MATIYETLIQQTIEAFVASRTQPEQSSPPDPDAWSDLLRPFFMKDDTAEGAKRFAQIMQAPQEEKHQEEIRTVLREHLYNNPEAVNKLEMLLEKDGREAPTSFPE